MDIQYKELKDGVKEDFERFSQWGFNEKQILPAILNEYKYSEGFSQIENICIHIFIILNYRSKMMNYNSILVELKKLVLSVGQDEIKVDLGKEYDEFVIDLNNVLSL